MKTVSILPLLLSLTLLPLAEQSQDDGSRYPNELVGYKLHEKAKWKSLKPLISTMADVRRVLGNPSEAHDTSQYTKPYPGDALANSVL